MFFVVDQAENSLWTIEREKDGSGYLVVELAKQNETDFWPCLLKVANAAVDW